jgi:hypothetical protein
MKVRRPQPRDDLIPREHVTFVRFMMYDVRLCSHASTKSALDGHPFNCSSGSPLTVRILLLVSNFGDTEMPTR